MIAMALYIGQRSVLVWEAILRSLMQAMLGKVMFLIVVDLYGLEFDRWGCFTFDLIDLSNEIFYF